MIELRVAEKYLFSVVKYEYSVSISEELRPLIVLRLPCVEKVCGRA